MSYRQVRDILNDIRDHHRRFRDALARVDRESGGRADVEYIAKALQRHEQHWQMALARYGSEGEDAILNTWLQFKPDETVLKELDELTVTRDMSVDDVADLAIRFHNRLVDSYAMLARAVSAPRVQAFFERLVELEQTVTAERAWSIRNS